MSERTVEDVEKVIRHAKLDPEHLDTLSQNMFFGQRLLDQTEIRLMEVPARLADVLAEGQTLVIRGDGDDSAVLCSDNMTFDLKEAETSNSFLLIEGLHYPDKDSQSEVDDSGDRRLKSLYVEGIFHRYLELRECKPRLSKLRLILGENLFAGMSSIVAAAGPTTRQLLDRVQCSEKELQQGLCDLRAVHVPAADQWYLLDQDYHMRVWSHISNFIAENSWSFDKVDKAETVSALQELEPDFIVEQIFEMYFSAQEDHPGKFRVHRERVCRFFGEYLLQMGTTFDLAEFLSMWSQSMPEAENDTEGFVPDLSHLRGLALVNNSSTPQTIRSFAEHCLSDSIHDRLETLFRVREKWTVDDIAPYVDCLTTPTLNVNGLLTKYARAANVNGQKVFCSKHGK